jgi:integrase
VDEIGIEHVLEILEPIWSGKPETAGRVRMRIENILDAAKTLKLRSGENPARWRGNLAALLPQKAKLRRVKHHPAMEWRKVPSFFQSLQKQTSFSARAQAFVILTAARSGEVRMARWSEITWKTHCGPYRSSE